MRTKPVSLIVSTLAALTSPLALAATSYEFRQPMVFAVPTAPSAVEPPVAQNPVTLALSEGALPPGAVGALYEFDLSRFLTIEGDDPPSLNALNWQATGTLPNNIELTDKGMLLGTPTETGSSSFEVAVSSGTTSARQLYTIVVGANELRVAGLALGSAHSCAITESGGVLCWGSNLRGQLGDGTTTNSTAPVVVKDLTNVVSLAAGGSHTCAVTSAGEVYCWGNNQYGALGLGHKMNQSVPVRVPGLSGVLQVSAGSNSTCVVLAEGAKCWGYNGSGQLGDNSTTDKLSPVAVSGLSTGIQRLSMGNYATCAALADGSLYCWGANVYGMLGDPAYGGALSAVPRRVPMDHPIVDVSVSAGASICATDTQGSALCWGGGGLGALGNGSSTNQARPTPVTGITTATQVRTNTFGGCALLQSGEVRCWGSGTEGQLGNGLGTNSSLPVQVSGLVATQIYAGNNHSCAVVANNVLKCWGANTSGQLGDGSTTNQLSPVAITP